MKFTWPAEDIPLETIAIEMMAKLESIKWPDFYGTTDEIYYMKSTGTLKVVPKRASWGADNALWRRVWSGALNRPFGPEDVPSVINKILEEGLYLRHWGWENPVSCAAKNALEEKYK